MKTFIYLTSLVLFSSGASLAGPEVAVVDFAKGTTEPRLLEKTIVMKNLDPNFPKLGQQQFKVMDLKDILPKNLPKWTPITILAKDQFIGSLTYGEYLDLDAKLAFSANGKPIPKRYGGPIKVMFPKLQAIELYTWYVKSILIGETKSPSLSIWRGEETSSVTIKELVSYSRKYQANLPMPMGYAPNRPKSSKSFHGVTVRDLLSQLKIAESEFIVAKNIAGETYKISKANYLDLILASQVDNRPISPSQGGSFSIISPTGSSSGFVRGLFYVTSLTMESK